MATWLGEQQVMSADPSTNMAVGYSSVTRNGNRVSYTIGVRAHTTSSGGWRNNRWACSITAGNNSWSNQTIKNKTSGTIGTTWYYANGGGTGESCPFSGTVDVGTDATSFNVSVQFADTGYSTGWQGVQATKTYTIPVPALPSISSFSLSNATESSVQVNWSSNMTCDATCYYKKSSDANYSSVNIGGDTAYKLTGLQPNTTYNIYIKIWVRGDGGRYRTNGAANATTLAKPSLTSIATSYGGKLPVSTSASENVTFTLVNPNSVSIDCYVKRTNASGTQFGKATTTGTSGVVAADVATMRSALGTSSKDTFYCYCVATLKDGSSYTFGEKTGDFWQPTFTATPNEDCTITVNWTSPIAVTKIQYTTDDSTYKDQAATGTSGSFKITGLAGSATYQVRIKAVTSSNGTAIAAAATSVKTSDWPYLTSIGTTNLAIGSAQKFTMLNPSKYTVTVKAKLDNDTEINLGTNASATGVEFSLTPSADSLYNSIPTKTSGNITYWCVYNNHEGQKIKGTYYLDTNACKPTFDASKVTYTDTNSTMKTLMGDDGVTLVQGKSNLQVTVAAGSVAKGTAVKEYKTTIGNTSKTGTGALNFGVLNYSSPVNATVTLTDNRGLKTTVTKQIKYAAWSTPTATYTIERNNNYDTTGTLVATQKFSSLPNSSNSSRNAINSFYYVYYNKTRKANLSMVATNSSRPATGASNTYYFVQDTKKFYEWKSNAYVEVTDTQLVAYGAITSGTKITFSNKFLSDCEYVFKIIITDKVGGSSTYTYTLAKGQPIMFVDSNKLGVGINVFPEGDGLYTQKIHIGNKAYLYYNSSEDCIEIRFE